MTNLLVHHMSTEISGNLPALFPEQDSLNGASAALRGGSMHTIDSHRGTKQRLRDLQEIHNSITSTGKKNKGILIQSVSRYHKRVQSTPFDSVMS
jgi:hypothetical protein